MLRLPLLLLAVALAAAPASLTAQGVGDARFVGRWEGVLRLATPLRLALEITRDSAPPALRATLYSVDQGNQPIPLALVIAGDTARVTAMGGALMIHQVLVAADTLRGELRQGGATLPISMVRVAAATVLRRPQMPRAPYPYDAEDVTIESAPGVQLSGTLTLPRGAGPFPAAVLVSGSGPQDRDESLMGHKPFLVLADHLTRNGIAVLRYDDRGVGRSTGLFSTATSADFAIDAGAAVAALRRHPRVNAARVGIIGHSEGGMVGPMVAVRDSGVAWLVLLAAPGIRIDSLMLLQLQRVQQASGVPAATMAWNLDLMRRSYGILRGVSDSVALATVLADTARASLTTLPAPDRAAINEQQLVAEVQSLTAPWFRWFIRYDPGTVLDRVRVPILALNGTLDVQVVASENLAGIRAAAARAGNPWVRTEQLPGLNHLFQTASTGGPAEYGTIEETMAPGVLALITQWIQERAR